MLMERNAHVQLNNGFPRLRQAKFDYGGTILSSSIFSPLPQLPQKMGLALKVDTMDSKIITIATLIFNQTFALCQHLPVYSLLSLDSSKTSVTK
jgi:hypothetical protein